MPATDPAQFGVAVLGDTKTGDLCQAKVYVAEGVVVDVAIDVIGDQETLRTAQGLVSFLRGRSYDDVVRAVTARTCASDGCSSVDGHCFSLVQEAIYRALGDYAARQGSPPQYVGTPAGAVDITRQKVPPPQPLDPPEPSVEEWARSRIIRE